MRSNTKVKVRTADLLAAVVAKREKMIKDHTAKNAKYDSEVDLYRAEVVKALRDRADKVEKGGNLPDTSGYGSDKTVRIPIKKEKPRKDDLNLYKIDRTIATLKIAAEDAISISADDYAEYLG